MKVLGRISDKISEVSEVLAGILIGSVTLILLSQVILRFIFNSGLTWAPEYARMATIWAVMLVTNSLVKKGELINADFFDSFWSEGFIRYRNMFYQLVFTILLIVLCKKGLDLAIASLDVTTPSLQLSWFYAYLAIPVGSFLILYQYIYIIIRNIRGE